MGFTLIYVNFIPSSVIYSSFYSFLSTKQLPMMFVKPKDWLLHRNQNPKVTDGWNYQQFRNWNLYKNKKLFQNVDEI